MTIRVFLWLALGVAPIAPLAQDASSTDTEVAEAAPAESAPAENASADKKQDAAAERDPDCFEKMLAREVDLVPSRELTNDDGTFRARVPAKISSGPQLVEDSHYVQLDAGIVPTPRWSAGCTTATGIIVLRVWDTRRNPAALNPE